MSNDIHESRAFFMDQSNVFKSVATSIEQKYIRKHNESPGKSHRDNIRPSNAYKHLSNSIISLGKEMYSFRKMLHDRTQDYVFATPSYSNMTSEEREDMDENIRFCLTEFEKVITQLGNRITTSDGLQTTERAHLQRVQEGLQSYLKECVEYVSLIKKEHLKRVQSKNKTLSDQVKSAQKNGYVFKYHIGINEIAADPNLKINEELIDRLSELKNKHKCLNYDPIHESDDEIKMNQANIESLDYDWVEKETKAEENDVNDWDNGDDWDNINQSEFTEFTKVRSNSPQAGLVSQNTEGVRNRRQALNYDPEQMEIRDSYQEWKNTQGSDYSKQFQEQTAIMKKEFIRSDKDDEIEKLEHQISEIQSLSSVFSEKILDQERDIDMINEMALHTTENLIDGNEWIRRAISNSALRRVFVLFCIIVFTFTLLFLDWYNP